MKGFGIVGALMLGLTVTASGLARKKCEIKGDLDLLQGAWTVVKTEGSDVGSKADKVAIRFEFEKETVRMIFGEKDAALMGVFSVKVDETAGPKAMDLTMTKSAFGEKDRDIGKTRLAIYKFDGDTLIISGRRGEGRPTGFSARPEDDQIVLHLKRVKK